MQQGLGLLAGEHATPGSEGGTCGCAGHVGKTDGALEIPTLAYPHDEPRGKASPAPDGSTVFTCGTANLEFALGAADVCPTIAELDQDTLSSVLDQAVRLAARIRLARERSRLVDVRHEVVGERQQSTDVRQRQCAARGERDVEDHGRAASAGRISQQPLILAQCGSIRYPPTYTTSAASSAASSISLALSAAFAPNVWR